jgi:hypothetical protein
MAPEARHDEAAGGTSNYDAFGRSSGQNNSLFLFLWMAF